MKAMIFAAGLGTRLRPHTNTLPKALFEINGVTLLELCIQKLIKHNFTDIVINIHHFPGKIIHFLEKKNYFDIHIRISDETDKLLDTGGGLLNTKSFFNDNNPFLIHNVDIISDINLTQMYEYHRQKNAMATLAVSDRKTSRYFRLSNENELVGWENIKTGDSIVSKEISDFKLRAFSGIHIVSPRIFDFIKKEGKFSIIPEYIEISKKNTIYGFEHSPENWVDVGKLENIERAVELTKLII